MPVFLLLAIVLSGCSSQAELFESQLNSYALAATRGAELSEWLTGNALKSALQSAELVQKLGLIGYGSSRFSETVSISQNLFESCMDVSGAQFRDSTGALREPPKLKRQLVQVSRQHNLVSDIKLSGVPC